MTKNDGGPAYPQYETGKSILSGTECILMRGGMSMRDVFAMAALQGMLCNGFRPDEVWTEVSGTYASAAYRLADFMLAERAK